MKDLAGLTCDTDAEMISERLSDVTDQIDGVVEATFGFFPFLLARWRICGYDK